MNDTTQRSRPATAARRPNPRGAVRRRRAASISDAVIAAYIHDLRRSAAATQPPRPARS